MPSEIIVQAGKKAAVSIRTSKRETHNKYNKTWAFFKGIDNFKKSVEDLEKQLEAFTLKASRNNPEDFEYLTKESIRGCQDRQETEELIHRRLDKLRNEVRLLSATLKSESNSPTQALNKHAELVERLRIMIHIIKQQEKHIHQELCQEEVHLEREMATLQRKFEGWSIKGPGITSKYLKNPSLQPHNLLPEIQKFEEFVANSGGCEQGWDLYEHQLFLKIRDKHKGFPSFLKEVEQRLAIKTTEQIVEHERWYRQFLELKAGKQEAIQRWRANKEKEKKMKEVEQQQDLEQLEKELQQREEAKERVRGWKEEKEKKLREEQEKEHLQSLYNKKKWKQEREQQEEMKKKVAQYRHLMADLQARWNREEEQRREGQRKQRAQEANQGIQLTQARDTRRLKSQLQERLRREKARQERAERIQRNRCVHLSSRDPQRLLRWTKSWVERQKEDDKAPKKTGFEGPPKLPHRAIPTWVRGLYGK